MLSSLSSIGMLGGPRSSANANGLSCSKGHSSCDGDVCSSVDRTRAASPPQVVTGGVRLYPKSAMEGLRPRTRCRREAEPGLPPEGFQRVATPRQAVMTQLDVAVAASRRRSAEAPALWGKLHADCLKAGMDFRELVGPDRSDVETPIEVVLKARDWASARTLFALLPPSMMASERAARGYDCLGLCRDGDLCGPGIVFQSTGAYYEGDNYKGLFHGWGRYVYPGGEEYVGMLDQGLRHGYGRVCLPSGQSLECRWNRGEPCYRSM
jgi:hypothetical protein